MDLFHLETAQGGFIKMNNKKFFYIFVSIVVLLLAPFTFCQASVLDLTNLTLNENGSVLTVKAMMDGGTSNIRSGGFKVTFPADRLQFTGVNCNVPGAMVDAKAEGCTLTVGYAAMSNPVAHVEFSLQFNVTGTGPYLVAANPGSLTGDISGAEVSRPGIEGTGIVKLTQPALWSVPDADANLFWVIPEVNEVTAVSLELNGENIIPTILNLSCWYWDQISNNGVFYLVLPGIGDLSSGAYPLSCYVTYGNKNTVQTATDVRIVQ